MNKKLTIHLVQWRVIPGDIEGNFHRAAQWIKSAAPDKGDLILLPELFASGFYYTALGKMAEEYDSVLRWMGETAALYEASVAGSAAVLREDGIANTMILVDRTGGTVASYDKAHLFFAGDEDLHFIPGKEVVLASHEGVVAGLAICFDLRFPEMTRKLCDDGARIVLISAQWPRARVDHFRDFVRVRAMENQLFIAACNSCGDDDKGLAMGGNSLVIGPEGEVRGSLGEEEGVLSVTIDIDDVHRARDRFPVLKVRRGDLFGG